ncbi:E3 ubiquitin-protein ligase RZFP34-like [Camellia sinensis]|uniref:E3 ubiquitin-protein ligase RZFP34-like n=1 Tax=Camellia sinensis TaxID=4442 RepID=UPI0010368199|nr:E3 ubiquitin-protein ligase RZFP34-like [Camellia sinensis]
MATLNKVVCSLCHTEQEVIQQKCIQCGVCMGKYYFSKSNFFNDDVSKNQCHCNKCGICRTGGKENFFHCNKCGCYYSRLMKDSHIYIEKAMHHNCPFCFEYLFETTKDITVLPYGHTIHLQCVKEMEQHLQYSCPVCSKSYCDMSQVWQRLDHEVASTPMPQLYKNKMVWILCNDCGETSEVNFHIVAHSRHEGRAVKLFMDEKVKRSKGYAFIQYTSQDDALLALESMDHTGRLKNGNIAAIKVLSPELSQGVKEFLTKIRVISDIEHQNLVKLYGCCMDEDHRILFYNYLENNSLAQTLIEAATRSSFLLVTDVAACWSAVATALVADACWAAAAAMLL